MNIIFFTDRGDLGKKMLCEFKEKKINIDYIFIESSLQRLTKKKIKSYIARSGYIKFFNMSIKNISKKYFDKFDFNSYAQNIYSFKNFNSPNCVQLLKKIKPDLIVLGGSRILSQEVISIAGFGVINAHPGVLPYYRGVDVIAHAIYNGDDVGVTVHFVDAGIDTGDIISINKIEIKPCDTIDSLTEKSQELSSQMMCEVILDIINGKSLNRIKNNPKIGKLYKLMNHSMYHQTVKKLKNKCRNG